MVLIATLLVGLHVVLMIRYPIIYGGDTIARLITFPNILNGHQLPLLQVLIYCALRLAYHPASVFVLMALISAAACTGLYALTCQLSEQRTAGLLAALFYATHAFILYYSRVPYQEPLLVAGLTWGFYYLFRDSSASSRTFAALWFGVAGLARYEGWVAALSGAIFDILRSRKEARPAFRSAAVALVAFGWAPALWVFLNRDLSPPGTYVLDLALRWERLYRPYFIAKSALWWTESVVVFLALAGLLYTVLQERTRKDPRLQAILGFLALYFLALLFSGHGIDPDPDRILTEREAFVPITMLVMYGGIGVSALVASAHTLRLNRAFVPAMLSVVVIVATGYGLHAALARIVTSNGDDDLKTDFEVAQFLSQDRDAGGLLLATPLPLQPIRSYLEKVERWSGSKGAAAAQEMLRHSETTPLDYQRVVVYSWMPRKRLISGDRLPEIEAGSIGSYLRQNQVHYVVVFSDFTPEAPIQKQIVSWCADQAVPVHEFRNGNKAARVFAVPD